MDRMIYLSMAGAKAAMQRQDVLSHNLANVTTNGFRAELQAFRAVPVRGDGVTEGSETFFVEISLSGTVGDGIGLGTIVDADTMAVRALPADGLPGSVVPCSAKTERHN